MLRVTELECVITLALARTGKLSRAYHRQGFDVLVYVKAYTHTHMHKTSLMLSSPRYNYRSRSLALEIVPSILNVDCAN